ncbi:MAG: toll/interleukin-1 receptor domain-containing protein [Ktedonobacteraceae bacterium]|nr:toll/interleukin-1 receptor domain-containing protein [Ktedonobacteraceae bacterium]
MPGMRFPIEIFCFSTPVDRPQLQKLEAHLGVLKQQGLISIWHDHYSIPGTEQAHTIDTHLDRASIILFLISPAFLASDSCADRHMERALQRYQANEPYRIQASA